jgi:molybdate transport system substrate-binding protein
MRYLLTVLLLLTLAACSSNDGADNGSADQGSADQGSADQGSDETLTVLAASSLTGSFEDLADTFEKDHPGVKVVFSFDSSATLAEQAAQGAPGDVLATADQETMQSAVEAGVVTDAPQQFAENQMVLVAPSDNPAGIKSFADIAGTDFVICVDTAPCGKVAAALLDDNDVTAAPASLEVDVKSVLAKVTEGEADAGMVYQTDEVAAGDDVVGFPVPGAENELTDYFVAPLEQSKDATLAQEWIDLVTGAAGQQVLKSAGFITS